MIIYENIIEFAQTYLYIYSIIDCIEIIFFIAIIFAISSWLNKDHTKPLLLYFYIYFCCLSLTYFFQLITVYQLLMVTAPIYLSALVIHHQKSLQKNFILSQRAITAITSTLSENWLEILVRGCMVAWHHKKNITCVIEQSDSLDTLIEKPFEIDVAIQKQIMTILLESVAYDDDKLILINRHGKIVCINATWSDLVVNELIFSPVLADDLVKKYAQLVSSMTDAIVFHMNSKEQNSFIAHQGMMLDQVTVDQALKIMKNIIYKKQSQSLHTKRDFYDQSSPSSVSNLHKN